MKETRTIRPLKSDQLTEEDMVELIASIVAFNVPSNGIIYNNAQHHGLSELGYSTTPGEGGSQIVKAAKWNSIGANCTTGSHRLANDFKVSPKAWKVTRVLVHAYSYAPLRAGGSAPPLISFGNCEIRANGVDGAVLLHGTFKRSTRTTVVLTLSSGQLPNPPRTVQVVEFEFPDVTLQPGTYWVTYDLKTPDERYFSYTPHLLKSDGMSLTGANAQIYVVNEAAWRNLSTGQTQERRSETQFTIEGQILH